MVTSAPLTGLFSASWTATLTKVSPNLAAVEHSVMSQNRARSQPAPTAGPLTAGRQALLAGYRGTRGCKISLLVFPSLGALS